MSPYNSNVPEPNCIKRRCEGSLDTVVIPFVLVFQNASSFLRSSHPKIANFRSKMDVLSPHNFWEADFHGVPPLTNNTAKTSFGEDLVQIRPAVAHQSRRKKNQNGHCQGYVPLTLDVVRVAFKVPLALHTPL